jgi:toxin HigB-1
MAASSLGARSLPGPRSITRTVGFDICNVAGYSFPVIKSFAHKGLERFYRSGSKSGIRPEHAKRLRSLLLALDTARTPVNMDLPGTDLHRLAGDLQGFWAVRVSGNWRNWRLFFQFEGETPIEVNYGDYH